MNLREQLKQLTSRVDEIEAIIDKREPIIEQKQGPKMPPGWECEQAREFRRIKAERQLRGVK